MGLYDEFISCCSNPDLALRNGCNGGRAVRSGDQPVFDDKIGDLYLKFHCCPKQWVAKNVADFIENIDAHRYYGMQIPPMDQLSIRTVAALKYWRISLSQAQRLKDDIDNGKI